MPDSDRDAHDAAARAGLEASGDSNEPTERQDEGRAEPSQNPEPSEPPIDAVEGPPSRPPAGKSPGNEGGPPDHNRRIADWTQRLALVTAALVFVGFCQIGAALLQWDAMNGQLKEMRGSAATADALDNATNSLADAAANEAQADNSLAVSTSDEVGALSNSVKAAQQLANAAVVQAGAASSSAQTAHDALTTVQRAFIVVNEMKQTASEKGNFFVAPVIENGGNTPAFITEYIALSPKSVILGKDGGQDRKTVDWAVAAPSDPADYLGLALDRILIAGRGKNITLGPKASLVPAEGEGSGDITGQDAMSQAGQTGRFFYGAIRYTDVFRASHITKYCFRIDRARVVGGSSELLDPSRCNHWNCTDKQCDEDKKDYAVHFATATAAWREFQAEVQAMRTRGPPQTAEEIRKFMDLNHRLHTQGSPW
jgi:hypothetical protein